jgi:hypothetical protein
MGEVYRSRANEFQELAQNAPVAEKLALADLAAFYSRLADWAEGDAPCDLALRLAA